MDIGCYQIDTSIYTQRGLIPNIPIHTSIRNSDSRTHQGSIRADLNCTDPYCYAATEPAYDLDQFRNASSSFKFCNVHFKDLYQAISSSNTHTSLYIENCEFDNNVYAAHLCYALDDCRPQEIHDTEFCNTSVEDIRGQVYADNIKAAKIIMEHSTLTNSEIISNTNSYCIYGQNNTITNNIFRNCSRAIRMVKFNGIIEYNLIQSNEIGIDLASANIDLHFNNFIDNEIHIKAPNGVYSHNCSNNYFGTTNESAISNSILDACNRNGLSSVTVCFFFFR